MDKQHPRFQDLDELVSESSELDIETVRRILDLAEKLGVQIVPYLLEQAQGHQNNAA